MVYDAYSLCSHTDFYASPFFTYYRLLVCERQSFEMIFKTFLCLLFLILYFEVFNVALAFRFFYCFDNELLDRNRIIVFIHSPSNENFSLPLSVFLYISSFHFHCKRQNCVGISNQFYLKSISATD